MKKLVILIVLTAASLTSFPQAQELEELALDIEKLAQFKQILADMKKGYSILSGGYNTIKNLSQGNFNLHKEFLDGLMAVSPTVKKYKKIAGIIEYQGQMVREYKTAFNRFRQARQFNVDEIDYISKVYAQLLNQSFKNLESLLMVITASQVRMSDAERLAAIDTLYESMEDKISFLRHFNNQTSLLALQRAKDAHSIGTMRSLYGIEK